MMNLTTMFAKSLKPFYFLQHTRTFSTSKQPSMLHGVRVLDLTRILAGPYSTMFLADFGADVIKIEPPEGDETRKWGPPFKGDDATYYLSINRSKQGLCLNLKQQEALDIFYELVKKSDIVIENFAPGVTDRLKIDYATLSKLNPGLIYASLTAYGTEGPWAKKPGFDMINQSMSGLLHITGHPDTPPAKVGVAVTDIVTGLTLGNGILAALYERTKTGKGKRIETSLMESMISGLTNIWSAHLNGGADPKRQGNRHPSIAPSGIYETADGRYIAVFCSDKQFIGLCEALELDGIATDKRFSTNKARVENMNALEDILKKRMKEIKFETALKKIEEKRVPVGPVNSVKDVFESEHIEALKLVKTMETEKYGKIKLVRNPIKVDGEYCDEMGEPPGIGEDSKKVLQEVLGYSEEEILELQKKKVL